MTLANAHPIPAGQTITFYRYNSEPIKAKIISSIAGDQTAYLVKVEPGSHLTGYVEVDPVDVLTVELDFSIPVARPGFTMSRAEMAPAEQLDFDIWQWSCRLRLARTPTVALRLRNKLAAALAAKALAALTL